MSSGPSRATARPGKPFADGPITTLFQLKHLAVFRQLEDGTGSWRLHDAWQTVLSFCYKLTLPDTLLRLWRYINHLLTYLLTYLGILTQQRRRCIHSFKEQSDFVEKSSTVRLTDDSRQADVVSSIQMIIFAVQHVAKIFLERRRGHQTSWGECGWGPRKFPPFDVPERQGATVHS